MKDATSLQLLLVEHDPQTASLVRQTLCGHFSAATIRHCSTVAQATAVDPAGVDLVLSDMSLPDGSGLDLLDQLLKKRPDLPVVLVTGEGVLETAIEAIRRGAYDYIVKAGDYLFAIPLTVQKNLAIWRTKHENQHLAAQLTRTLQQVRIKNRQLEKAVSELERTAATDPLTCLANRRAIADAILRMFADFRRHDRDLACIMIDLDGFKQLNDTLGHQRGDDLLQCTAGVLERYCRQSDMAGRFGGDEFIVLLPETDVATARRVARRIGERYRLESARLCTDGTVNHHLTMSMGLATLRHTHPSSPEQLMAQADDALCRAKQAGKTCVMVYQNDREGRPNASPARGTPRTSAAPRRRASLSAR